EAIENTPLEETENDDTSEVDIEQMLAGIDGIVDDENNSGEDVDSILAGIDGIVDDSTTQNEDKIVNSADDMEDKINSSQYPLPVSDENKVVNQLNEVADDSEEKASQIFDVLSFILDENSEISKYNKSMAEFIEQQSQLLESLSSKFPNAQRKFEQALEGELGRSLESISGILSASVKIAIPKESVFTQRKTDPTASAVLNLREGTALSQRQIEGIKNFIASAIPKLKPENIKLINQNGSLLENNPESMESLKYIEHEKYKTKLENDYENKIKDLLLPFLGDQRVVAKVSIELDFTKQEINQEIYEPEGTIRSQQTTEIAAQSDAKEPQTGGVPGAESNIEDPDNDNNLKTKKTSKEEAKNVTNYEISKKIISQRNNAYAGISKITAAVTYDSAVLEKVENKEEFVTSLNSIVQVAIGYRENRGDSVTVKSFKFIGLQPFGTKPEDMVNEEDSLGLFSTQAMIKEYGEYIHEEYENLFDEFDARTEQSKLKAKVKSQILSNLDGLSAEESAKYEVLIEQIEKSVSDHPEDIAQMILMLLNEDKVLAKLARLQEAKQAFSYLDNIDPKQLADFIKDESPQTIAVVLAHMDAEDASMVLSKLDDTLKVKISMQMATIKDVSPSIVQSMSKVLEKKLESLLASIVTVGGVKTVADMLNKMGSKSTEILENIQGLDPQLAAKIKENMFVFEDLLALDTNDIMKVLGNIETEDLTIALKNATEEDMAIIMGSMSQRARDRFKEEFEMLGRTKIKDIEDAQRKILDVAMGLLESGEIERIDEE
ncbi:putative multi-domain containing protein, partial [Aduncisulcus paluster]